MLPNNGNALRRLYNRMLYEIARSKLLAFIVSQIARREITVAKLDPDLHLEILETEYALS